MRSKSSGARARKTADVPAPAARAPVPPAVSGGRMFKATEAKNRFGAIMKLVDNAQPVFIEKHGTARAVVLDIDSYTALVQKARAPEELRLEALKSEFEDLYAAMQTERSRAGVDALLSAGADELNKAVARPKARG